MCEIWENPLSRNRKVPPCHLYAWHHIAWHNNIVYQASILNIQVYVANILAKFIRLSFSTTTEMFSGFPLLYICDNYVT